MDNAKIYHSERLEELLRSVEALIYRPPFYLWNLLYFLTLQIALLAVYPQLMLLHGLVIVVTYYFVMFCMH